MADSSDGYQFIWKISARIKSATFTRAINTGTPTNGLITAIEVPFLHSLEDVSTKVEIFKKKLAAAGIPLQRLILNA